MSTSDPFADAPEALRNTLTHRGFTALTAVQRAVLGADSLGHDLRISSQTGSGKTVALGLALARSFLAPHDDPETEAPPPIGKRPGPVALIITPTRELAQQVCEELRWLLAELPGMRIDYVTGGTDLRGERRMLRRPPTILVATPGRLLDHMRAEAVRCATVEHVVLDEADRMLEMGFREDLEAIIDLLPKERSSHLVSATFSGPVRHVADRFQRNPIHLEGTKLGEANEDIDHVVHLVAPLQRYATLVNALLLALNEQVLVFVDRRIEASELAEQLAGDGFAALPFSGDLSQAQRNRTLHAFRTGTIQVLVSTDVAARGIDVPNISMVVHMSPPHNADDYTHRSGRTGRAGRQGRSIMMVPPRAQFHAERLLSGAKIDVNWQPVPTPAKIHKAITKRTRRQLHEHLDGEEGPTEKTLNYAAQLIEGRDPATVIATLLEMAEPRLPRDPLKVEPLTPRTFDRNDRHRGGPSNDQRHRGRGTEPARGAKSRRGKVRRTPSTGHRP
ncbi:MAG: DEAD/DEAH box helicase [Deltaproteobacteria bacterium]|nr:DEAD/DEAH box helicase [Deltaproteobacteria bacterium]